ncbi:hypothetical protein AVEN_174106-1 [Araneus ventricosus]|uniref:Uncharacterized protein n=1 Tax=Araneus ventricosus TaxID=182803 RepID=A0A4Y2C1H5_ARAVE|nr:hypothetical protein AVEN_174106-1 [Araneus ventricosus]
MQLVVVTLPIGRGKCVQYNCSTEVNTCEISLGSLATLTLFMMQSNQQERNSSSNCATRRKQLDKMRYVSFNKLKVQASTALVLSKFINTTVAHSNKCKHGKNIVRTFQKRDGK